MADALRDRTRPIPGSYSLTQRAVETVSLVVFVALACYASALIARTFGQPRNVVLASAGFFSALAVADFMSGLVHWAADTWGRPTWPIVGNAFIRGFREHHVDPAAITRHDFVETNGANALVSLPALAAAVYLFEPTPLGVVLTSVLTSLCLWILATNQFHKWAHQDSPPRWVQRLQNLGLILSPAHHGVHHRHPFAQQYCITTGWLNSPLTRLRFFPRLEALITFLTGAMPRAHDPS